MTLQIFLIFKILLALTSYQKHGSKLTLLTMLDLWITKNFHPKEKKKRKVEDTFIVTDNNLPQSRDAYDLLVSILQLWFKIQAKFPLILFLMTMTIMNKERQK